MDKVQRLLDPIHGLIVFRSNDPLGIDALAWQLLNTREFQRLRRIRQLGFSEFVFPCTTHTRYIHSIGVYHMARRLLSVVRRSLGSDFDPEKARVAGLAALLHDIGHGPFSHTFETVEKKIGRKKDHEDWSAEIITGDTEVSSILKGENSKLAENIARILKAKFPENIYHSIVSSQFDADRMDYLLRDRYMAGIESGGFDLAWILDCLEVGKIMEPQEDGDPIEVDGLCINHKGIGAAENYILTRFQYYDQVYFHKTTRGAEKMLGALLLRVSNLLKAGKVEETGIDSNHPVSRYFLQERPPIDLYLSLDDNVVWSSLGQFAQSSDPIVKSLAMRLLNRKLFKCADLSDLITSGDAAVRIKPALKQFCDDKKLSMDFDVLQDKVAFNGYGRQNIEDGGALKQIWVRSKPGERLKKIDEHSKLVKAVLEEKELYRVYVPDLDIKDGLTDYLKEAMK